VFEQGVIVNCVIFLSGLELLEESKGKCNSITGGEYWR
jgi:hypothetical protein